MYHLNQVSVLNKYLSLIYKKGSRIWTSRKRGLWGIFLRKYLKVIQIFVNLVFQDMRNYEILEKPCFPKYLKLSDITPVYKKKDPTLVEHYRPVSLLISCIPKAFERIIQK